MTNEETIKKLKEAICYTPYRYGEAFEMAIEALEFQSKIVRCKDCKYFHFHHPDMKQPWGVCFRNIPYLAKDADDFCKYGEGKDD